MAPGPAPARPQPLLINNIRQTKLTSNTNKKGKKFALNEIHQPHG